MVPRSHWFDDSFLRSRGARLAQDVCDALGATERQRILDCGDELATTSVAVAQRFFLQAPSVLAEFGATGFEAWWQAGRALVAGEPPNRGAAHAYFAVSAKTVAAVGVEAMLTWARAGSDVAGQSRRLAAEFLAGTAPVLARIGGEAAAAWAREGIGLCEEAGWRGELLARGLFQSSAILLPVLTPEDYRPLARVALALAPASREASVLTTLPEGFHLLRHEDRQRFFAAVARVADDDPRAAATLYRDLPGALRRLHVSLRGRVVRILTAAAGAATAELCEVIPVAAALVRGLPQPLRGSALDRAAEAAEAFPRAAIALLRSLPFAYEEAPPEGVDHWIERGLALARENPDAGLAYFARESRTSHRILHASSTATTLDDVQGILRKFVRMISGRPASIRAASSAQLRPELEEFPLEDEIALPLRIDRFATYEDNARLYRFLAAHLAGRRLFGTYEAGIPERDGKSLFEYVTDPQKPALLEETFLVTEGFRIASRLRREFAGIGREQRELSDLLLDRADSAAAPPRATALDLTFLWLLSDRAPASLPPWLQPIAMTIGPCVMPLALASATVDDALTIAEHLTRELADRPETRGSNTYDELAFEKLAGDGVYDMLVDDDGPGAAGDTPAAVAAPPPPEDPAPFDRKLELDGASDTEGSGASMSPDELQALLEAGANLKIRQGTGGEAEGLGLYVSDLLGKLPRELIEELQRVLGETQRIGKVAPRRWLERRAEGASFYYDEWDYHIQDYRQRWCRLLEVPVASDSGEFFQQTLADYSELIPEVRRQFQRIRPETYRMVRGLEHGEDFDLNAVVDARVDLRARRNPTSRLYVARQREEREVATLFLIDLSASTDEPFASSEDAPHAATRKQPRRIIDVTKEALVIMAEALEEIGDAYAIYGFSGHGRKNVEFYMVKSFNESLSGPVKGRIGALEPKRSTRMGAALRHATEKMSAVRARSRHIILLSDGFPQDFDYGQDRRSNVYGLRDTTVALREAEAAGIVPFCLTVDKSGHDYLREMCDEASYMVLDDIAALPSELPKVYQRVVRV